MLAELAATGSPPQVRGKPRHCIYMLTGFRITPAGAGKTIVPVLFLCLPADHPRRCGENTPFWYFLVAHLGSPPQVRGKPTPERGEGHRFRITPAGAGKTTAAAADTLDKTDHPRRCGENCLSPWGFRHHLGSPPQVRGKLICVAVPGTVSRITPAGAGKTFPFVLLLLRFKDHPRRCGENRSRARCSLSTAGSPPQVRGKLFERAPPEILLRITPAGAGKTHTADGHPFAGWDHPRRCGENIITAIAEAAPTGSPPQVRGKLILAHLRAKCTRITPAGAGKTSETASMP